MRRGFVYLAAVLDWATRRVLSWELSNSLTVDFCLEAIEAAIRNYGTPEILNTDQGSQFTCSEFVGLVQNHGVQLSMDGKGSWRDNVFVERLWKSVKHEEVYLHAYDSVDQARQGLQALLLILQPTSAACIIGWSNTGYGLLRRAATASGSLMLNRQSFT